MIPAFLTVTVNLNSYINYNALTVISGIILSNIMSKSTYQFIIKNDIIL